MKGFIQSAFFVCLIAYSRGAGEKCTNDEDCSVTVERCSFTTKTCKVTLGGDCITDSRCGANEKCESGTCRTSIGRTCTGHMYCSIGSQACDGKRCVARCKSDADCGDGEKCLTGRGKLYCKASCDRDSDCKRDSERCMLVNGKKHCRERCTQKIDCAILDKCSTGNYCEAKTPATPICNGCCPVNCDKNYCSGRGKYSVTDGKDSCKCDGGYTGNKCQTVSGANSVQMSVTLCMAVLIAVISAL